MSEVGDISESLEDYLEIIFHLVAEKKVARVKDIASRKNVRMASVTSALKRLAKDEYVQYSAREFVELTNKGAEVARRIVHRHEFLRRFFREILFLDDLQAEKDACSIEHHLSLEAMERMAAFYQFVNSDEAMAELSDRFKRHCLVDERSDEKDEEKPALQRKPLVEMEPGQHGVVTRLRAPSNVRKRLVEIGIMPTVQVSVDSSNNNKIVVLIKGYPITVAKDDAEAIEVEVVETEPNL